MNTPIKLKGGASVKPSELRRWIKDLRSGDFTQGKGQLENNGKFCCLGVLAKTQGSKGKVSGSLNGGFPSVRSHGVKAWTTGINIDFVERTGVSLVTLNDQSSASSSSHGKWNIAYDLYQHTFEDIANLLELVYFDGILEEPAA